MIEIAGVPVMIRCRYRQNREFFHDYYSEGEPRFTVEPTAEDMDRIQADFDRLDDAAGIPKRRGTDEFLENNAIHALLAKALVAQDVLLMHGSALCMDGQAIIFTAKSGTGKSTHARLWREAFGDRVWMINDDKPMLRVGDTGVTVYGTPWDGKHHLGRNASAPLKAIVSLERSEENWIRPMPRADAFPIVMKQAYFSMDAVVMAQIIQLEKRLLGATDFYALGCNMQPEAAKVAWEGMNAGEGVR